MSVVGPRPLLVRYLPLYSEHQARRHTHSQSLCIVAEIVALPIKVIYTNYVCDKNVMNRRGISTLAKLGVDFIFFGVIVYIRWRFPIVLSNWKQFFICGVGLSIGLSVLVIGIHVLLYPEFKRLIISKKSLLFN